MKLVPILEASYANIEGGLSDEEMLRKFFSHDQQLADDIAQSSSNDNYRRQVVKAFFPKKGLNVFYQYSGTAIKHILLLRDGTWLIEDDADAHRAKSLDGIQLHQTVYAQ